MTPIDTIQAFHRQEVTFIQLLRAIITYESWHFPTRNDQPLLALHQEQQLLLLFSSKENFSSQNTDEVQPTVQTGAWLSHQLSTNIDSIVIDAGQSHSLQMPAKYFPVYQKIAAAVQIERLLAGNDTQQNVISHLTSYKHYLVPIVQDSDGLTHITLAPDSQGRQFAAVFTAEDCLQAFVTASQQMLGEELQVHEISGRELFNNLKQLNIEGVVFNCYGPVSPRAISKEFIDLVSKQK